jgi:GNAT superfamily N-acetyltransferase
MSTYISLQPRDASQQKAITNIWNAACGKDLTITPRFVSYNLQPFVGVESAGRLSNDQSAAIVVSSREQRGWIDMIAVHPETQRRGVGTELLRWAEGWLSAKGCKRIQLGGSYRWFVPGLPQSLEAHLSFFTRNGYSLQTEEWDVEHDLTNYVSPRDTSHLRGSFLAAQQNDIEPMREFFARNFAGRWSEEFEQHIRDGARISDYHVLWIDGAVEGFALLTFDDSARTLDRFFMHGMSQPRGQLGAIGVSERVRGRGYGGALLDAGLRRLKDAGIRGCVIDWTDLVDFYAKFGFRPRRKYLTLAKELTTTAINA